MRSRQNQCPLCQQPLPQDFYAEIRKVFDKTYEQRLGLLQQLESRYRDAADQFLRRCEAPEYQLQAIKLRITRLHAVFQKNLQSLATKLASPSLTVTLESTATLVAELNSEIAAEQLKIDVINARIKTRSSMRRTSSDASGAGTELRAKRLSWHSKRSISSRGANARPPRMRFSLCGIAFKHNAISLPNPGGYHEHRPVGREHQ